MQNIKIIPANRSHKQEVLELLDDFRTYCYNVMLPEEKIISKTAITSWWDIFNIVMKSSTSEIFLAISNKEIIWICTINLIPQIRKWWFYAEIEEMYIKQEYRGTWVANKLLLECENWAKNNKALSIRLESAIDFKRAHSFYTKEWFNNYWKAFEKTL